LAEGKLEDGMQAILNSSLSLKHLRPTCFPAAIHGSLSGIEKQSTPPAWWPAPPLEVGIDCIDADFPAVRFLISLERFRIFSPHV
jgi:hypothetical protein